MPSKHTNQGLTLIELLVAISVLGFLAILGWRGLDSIVRTRVALNNDLVQTRGMQLTFAQLQSDCAHLASPSILADRRPIAAGQDWLALVRTVFTDNHPSRLQVVTYRIKDGMLTRRESIATRDLHELDTLWLTALNDTDTSPAVVLQSEVTAMTMRVWFNGGNEWSPGPGALAPSSFAAMAANPPAPTGLEVTLQLRGRDNGIRKIFLLGAV